MKKDINNRKLYSIIKLENLPKYLEGVKPIFYPHELLIDTNLEKSKYDMIRNQKHRYQTIKEYIEKIYMPILQEEKEFTIKNIFLFISRIKNKQKERDANSNKKSHEHKTVRYNIDEELVKQLDKTDAKDMWADKMWRERGKPTFKKRIITGVRYGKGFVITNNKVGFNRIVIKRYLGVRIKDNKIVINCPD